MKNIGIIILLGFVAGIMGGVLVNNYLDVYKYPQFKNVLLNNHANKGSIVIEKADKITIEQERQIKDVISLNQEKIVKIYKKKGVDDSDIPGLGEYYQFDKNVANGLIVTSDGWVIVNNFFTKKQSLDKILEDYIIVDHYNKVYKIDDFKEVERVVFMHIKDVQELPVTNIVSEMEIKKGEIVITINKHENINVSYIAGENEDFIKSCDKLDKEIILTSGAKNENSFSFNIRGGLISFSGSDGKMLLVDNFKFEILNLLNNNNLKKPLWGINYIDLTDIAIASSSMQKKGALVYNYENNIIKKGSMAEKIGLLENDIITLVNNREVNENNSLNYILQDYKVGDNLDITYMRDGQKNIINIDL